MVLESHFSVQSSAIPELSVIISVSFFQLSVNFAVLRSQLSSKNELFLAVSVKSLEDPVFA